MSCGAGSSRLSPSHVSVVTWQKLPLSPRPGTTQSALHSPGRHLEMPVLGFRTSLGSPYPSSKLDKPKEGAGEPTLVASSLVPSSRGDAAVRLQWPHHKSPPPLFWRKLLVYPFVCGVGPPGDWSLPVHQRGAFRFPSPVPGSPAAERAGCGLRPTRGPARLYHALSTFVTLGGRIASLGLRFIWKPDP